MTSNQKASIAQFRTRISARVNAPTGALAYVNVLRAPSPVALAVLVGCALSAVYLRWSPSAPDLAAQVARAAVVRRAGNISWWTGWFGGLSMPTYSVLAPSWMAAVGVRLAGVLAVVAGAAATATLVRDTRRPRIGAVAFAAAGMADLLDGRVTFAIGLAIAAWTLVAVREQWRLRGLVLGLATYLASPLAGLFLGLLLIAVVIVVRSRARVAILVAAALLVVGLAMAVLFPGTGVMPFTVSDSIPALLCAAGVAVLCRERIVR
ncbi:MAG TPA: hypothetical protein VK816_06305, partial [Jatrophihabitantaceae bacterium]|nr:hypothetical protein [Jatrophihabitantaceae bacterium]